MEEDRRISAMRVDEYSEQAQRTSSTTRADQKLENGILGLCGEVGELADLWKKYRFQGHPFDKERMAEELGDVMWYVVETARGLHLTLSEVCWQNVLKLRERYPDGFDPTRSINRH